MPKSNTQCFFFFFFKKMINIHVSTFASCVDSTLFYKSGGVYPKRSAQTCMHLRITAATKERGRGRESQRWSHTRTMNNPTNVYSYCQPTNLPGHNLVSCNSYVIFPPLTLQLLPNISLLTKGKKMVQTAITEAQEGNLRMPCHLYIVLGPKKEWSLTVKLRPWC